MQVIHYINREKLKHKNRNPEQVEHSSEEKDW